MPEPAVARAVRWARTGPLAPRDGAGQGLVDCGLALAASLATYAAWHLDGEANRPFWTGFGLAAAAPLLLAGTLELSRNRFARTAACLVHALLLAGSALVLLLCLLMAMTIVLLGAAIVVAPPAVLVGVNSVRALVLLTRELRAPFDPAHPVP